MNANMLFIKQSAQLRLHLHAVNSIRQCDTFANMLLHEPSKMTPLPLQPLIKFQCNKLLINAHTLFTRNSIWVATLTALPFFILRKRQHLFACLVILTNLISLVSATKCAICFSAAIKLYAPSCHASSLAACHQCGNQYLPASHVD